MNAGSQSLKLAVVRFDTGETRGAERPLARVLVDRIHDEPILRAGTEDGRESIERALPRAAGDEYEHALTAAFEGLSELVPDLELAAVGQRVVHGGPHLAAPVRIDAGVVRAIEAARVFAPLHNEPALACIRAMGALRPPVSQVAVFDTGFHAAMPERARRYAIDPGRADRHGIRRYGFHGLAHEWMSLRTAEALGRPSEDLRLVTLQLGGGCSAAAIDGGRSIDTSMGLTPLEGLVMATRSGDVDPALPGYLARQEGIGVEEVEQWLNHESGLLGLSGRSGDVRDLLRAEAEGDRRSALALEIYCYRLRMQVGAYLATLGGAHAVVLGGGVGQHQPAIRARALAGLEWAGLSLDPARNEAATGGTGEPARISADGCSLEAWVIPVDEERLLARRAFRCLSA